jgi:hypothetical protein
MHWIDAHGAVTHQLSGLLLAVHANDGRRHDPAVRLVSNGAAP